MIRALIGAGAFLALASPAFAVGSDDTDPPAPTDATIVCEDGFMPNPDPETVETLGACVPIEDQAGLEADRLYELAREFAYFDRLEDAQAVLMLMPDQTDDRVLTYMGFTEARLGRIDSAFGFYEAALAQNPDNLLARSYFGQAKVAAGDLAGARAQLTEIRQRGGRISWPAFALRQAIETGSGPSY